LTGILRHAEDVWVEVRRIRSNQMEILKKATAMLALACLCAPAMAQDDEELEAKMRQAEARLVQQEVQQAERVSEMRAEQAAQRAKVAEQRSNQIEVEVRMKDAEMRLAEAARQVADLSIAQLPRIEHVERIIRANRRPVLGVTIGSDDNKDPVEGVELQGVSPGGAAEEAGLRAGDVITSINDESLTADNSQEANAKLLDFMQGVEDGDLLSVEYLRNGKSDKAEIAPHPMVHNVFSFGFDGGNFSSPNVHVAPDARQFGNFIWTSRGDGFGDMELAPLTERLGSYFGTDEGLLVVRAPDNEDLQLQDGDVILNIDGRTPKSVAHAMRILGSYENGEELKIEIMRDKRKRSVTLEIPDNRQSSNWPTPAPLAPAAPMENVVFIEKEQGRSVH